MMKETLYPKSPEQVSRKLTSLTNSYKLKAMLSVLAIILFFILYSILILSTAYLLYHAVMYDIGRVSKGTILMKIGAIAGSGMLCLFTLKFITKLKTTKADNRLSVERHEQPELWAFIEKICEETHAPKPKQIYIDPDMNAYVSYTNMWLSLFLPVGKELTIGLGLVSCLNLSEFKAVISHEFGHFSQRAMKIGSYTMSSNTIIHSMIYSRDKWDEMLADWKKADLRLSAAAWLITPVIWVIRQTLALFYQLLNMLYYSLSREMEFNADRVAVATTGSEAIITALWKMENGFDEWNATFNHAYLAAQKKIYVENLYPSINKMMVKSGKHHQAALAELPRHEEGYAVYFSAPANSKVGMYESHPSNDLREKNAKSVYVECEEDTRSAWILFKKPEELQRQVTKIVNTNYLGVEQESYADNIVFETFIESETANKHLLEEYDDTFKNRFITIPDKGNFTGEYDNKYALSLKGLKFLKDDLEKLSKPVKVLEELMDKAVAISKGTFSDKTITFNEVTYNKKSLQQGYGEINDEREKLLAESFISWDNSFCLFHLALAKNNNTAGLLSDCYQQHIQIVELFKGLLKIKGTILNRFEQLQHSNEVTPEHITEFTTMVKKLIDATNSEIKTFDELNFVAMPNIDNTQELKEAIFEGGAFTIEEGPIFENERFGTFMNALEQAITHCQRIDQASIGVILVLHKELQKQLV